MTDNPFFATTVFTRGRDPRAAAVIAFHDTADNRNGWIQLATEEQVGAVHGVATNIREWKVWVAAGLKRGSPIGPGGIRQIYRIDLEDGTVDQWVRVIGVGEDPHDPRGGYFPDEAAVRWIGKRGIGDIDMGTDGSELYAVNLDTRQIHRYRTSEPALVGTWDIGSARESWAADARPFALKVQGSRLYHGVVRTAQSSGNPGDLRAYVYETSVTGGQAREVLSFSLNYERGNAYDDVSAAWLPWRDDVATVDPRDQRGVYPQPLLTDIEFAANGDMIIGLRDRYGDLSWDLPSGEMPQPDRPAAPAGDILVARRQGNVWRLEPEPEFYRQDAGPGVTVNGVQDELALGGLARVIVSDVVVTTALSPFSLGAGGALWFKNDSGENSRREPLHPSETTNHFANANGLGDVEILCGPLPPPDPGGVPTRVATPSPTTTASPTPTATQTSTPTAPPTASSTLDPTTTSTLVPPSSTATRTATRTASSTTTPTRTATRPSATPTSWTIWLPFNYQSPPCRIESRYVDVTLVLDRSTSMLRTVTPGGLTKNAAAIDAARRFVELMTLRSGGGTDRVAVVGFNDSAWTEIALGSDRASIAAALDRVEAHTAEGTRLDLALYEARNVMQVARSPGSKAISILLTDGLPNRVPTPAGGGSQEQTVLRASTALKSSGVRLITVGVGQPEDLSHWLLETAASSVTDYWYAPDASDLFGIYEQIAGDVRRCR